MTYALEHLFSTDILQSPIEILDLLHDVLHFILILTFNLARLSNGNVKGYFDATCGCTGEPATGHRVRVRGQADLVLASVSCGESEAA